MKGIIYKLTNTRNGKNYVGQTRLDLPRRVKQHSAENRSVIGRAIQKYGLENFVASIIDEADSIEALNNKEIIWIAFFNCRTPNGYNLTEGGAGVEMERNEKWCRRISRALIGKKRSKEHCRNISKAKRGKSPAPHTKYFSQAARKAIGEAQQGNKTWLGRTHTQKTKRKMKASWTPERKASMPRGKNHANWGMKASEETRRKLSVSHRGLKKSKETRRRLSEALKGRSFTPEVRAKISATLKAGFASGRIKHA
jgi:group I intron endonuclease